MFLCSGHTHSDLNLSDWVVRRVVPGTGNLEGFTVIKARDFTTGTWLKQLTVPLHTSG